MTVCAKRNDGAEVRLRYRWLIAFKIDGDLRFISHRDTVRLFERAIVRAGLPVRFTSGFNPHPKISLPIPRPVGVASEAEALVVETSELMGVDGAIARLNEQTTDGITIFGVRQLDEGERVEPRTVTYRLTPELPVSDAVREAAARTLESESISVDRKDPKKNKTRTLDVRPFIHDIECGKETVEFTLHVTPAGTVRPSEVAALLGYNGDAINHRIRRMEVVWQ